MKIETFSQTPKMKERKNVKLWEAGGAHDPTMAKDNDQPISKPNIEYSK